MAKILIEPITIRSLGGNPVIINGIRPTDHDCIVGDIALPGNRVQTAVWNLSGLMRGGEESTNIDMRSEELRDLAELVKQLGYRG